VGPFEQGLAEACERVGMRLLAYCVMPNHWHLVVWTHTDGDLSSFHRIRLAFLSGYVKSEELPDALAPKPRRGSGD